MSGQGGTPGDVPAGPPNSPLTLNKIRPGQTRSQVEAMLGKPDYEGHLSVKNNENGSYAEWGNRQPTWNGSPTVVYDQQQVAISVVGNEFQPANGAAIRLGDPLETVRARLPLDKREEHHGEETIMGCNWDHDYLTLTFQGGKLTRMVYFRG